jgi:hypothetical protein
VPLHVVEPDPWLLASAERGENEILGLERRLLGGDVRLAGTLRGDHH